MRGLTLLLIALPLAGCGGGGSQHISLADAATKSTGAQSVKLDMAMAMSTPQLPQPVTLTATGAEDNTNHRVQMNIDMSSLVGSFGAPGGIKPADFKGQEIGDLANGRLVIYMNLPFLTKLIPHGKPWIKIDLNAYGKSLGVNFSQFTSLSANPAQMVDWLRATSGSISKVGSETVDGVQTTHYHGTIDLSKYPNLVPPARRAEMRKAVNALIKTANVRTFPMDAWVDSDNLVRKLHLKFNETVKGQRIGLDMTLHFHDFGTPVSINLPPADQTVDLAKLTGKSKP
jgi:hypothetical protein